MLILNIHRLRKELQTQALMKYFIWKFSEGYCFYLLGIKPGCVSLIIAIFLFLFFQLQDYVEYMGSEVRAILVPSIRDANHDFVLPQVTLVLNEG